MTKTEINADALGISRVERKVRTIQVMPPGGYKTTRVREATVSLAAIPALERGLPEVSAGNEAVTTPEGARRGR